jgi:hypothetical protein
MNELLGRVLVCALGSSARTILNQSKWLVVS